MNNLKLKILEHAYAQPGLTVEGLADTISRGRKTEEDVRYLLKKGYLIDVRGIELSKKGLCCIDSSSSRNQMKRIGIGLLGIVVSVVTVVIGNCIWDLIQSYR